MRILNLMATLDYTKHLTLHRLGLRSLLPTSVQDRNPSPTPYPSPSQAMKMSQSIYKPIDMVPDGAGSAVVAPASVALAPNRFKPRVEGLVAPLPEVVVKLKPEVGALCPVKLKPVDPPAAPAAVVAVFGAKLNVVVALAAGVDPEGAVVFAVKLNVAAAAVGTAPWADVEVGAAVGAGVD